MTPPLAHHTHCQCLPSGLTRSSGLNEEALSSRVLVQHAKGSGFNTHHREEVDISMRKVSTGLLFLPSVHTWLALS